MIMSYFRLVPSSFNYQYYLKNKFNFVVGQSYFLQPWNIGTVAIYMALVWLNWLPNTFYKVGDLKLENFIFA